MYVYLDTNDLFECFGSLKYAIRYLDYGVTGWNKSQRSEGGLDGVELIPVSWDERGNELKPHIKGEKMFK